MNVHLMNKGTLKFLSWLRIFISPTTLWFFSVVSQQRAQRKRSGATRENSQVSAVNISSLWVKKITLLIFLCVALLAVGMIVRNLESVPVGAVILTGHSGSEVSASGAMELELKTLIDKQLADGFWRLNLSRLKATLEQHPWVRQAVIRRQWPNNLLIGIDEHVAVARWNDQFLLSATSKLFLAKSMEEFDYLPLFSIASNSREEVDAIQQSVVWFNQFQKPLLQHDVYIRELGQTKSRDLWLVLNSGLRIELGSVNVSERYQRFIGLISGVLSNNIEQAAIVDLRYPNGVAVSWKHGASSIALVESNPLDVVMSNQRQLMNLRSETGDMMVTYKGEKNG